MGCSRITAHECLKTSMIPHKKIGNIYLFPETEALKNGKSKKPNFERNLPLIPLEYKFKEHIWTHN